MRFHVKIPTKSKCCYEIIKMLSVTCKQIHEHSFESKWPKNTIFIIFLHHISPNAEHAAYCFISIYPQKNEKNVIVDEAYMYLDGYNKKRSSYYH